jgi:phosphoribosyl 1,2-cyclic phosphodiesterase
VEVAVLASGSTGNAVLVRSGGTSLLVDAGVSARQITCRLSSFGHSVDQLAAVLLTHEHSDHVRGLDVLVKQHSPAVWATAGTWSATPVRSSNGGELVSGRTVALGSIAVTPVATSHDAREPVAMVLDDGRHRLGLCTDTGTFTGLLEQRLAGCDLLLLEANHDADLLRAGSYPWSLKQRILSRLGHLGNHQAAEAVERLRSPELRAVVGLHLSAENNQPELVLEALHLGVGGAVPVHVVPRTEMLRISVGSRVEFERRELPGPRRRHGQPSR